jgi:CRP/FNR family transcriptional regulator
MTSGTSSAKTRGKIHPAIALAIEMKRPRLPAIPAQLRALSAVIRTRRGQTLSLATESNEAVFIVCSGVLTLHVTLAHGLRQVVAILYPGNVLRSAFAPSDAALTAVSAGEVWRLRWNTFESLAAKDLEIAHYFNAAIANQAARQAIHVAAVGRFDSEQRVATYLLEFALSTGTPIPGGGVVFDMPLSRTDIADYLGLNADTLSRTMSHLRSRGVLSHPHRQRALVRDFAALAALSPAAPLLLALYGECRSET